MTRESYYAPDLVTQAALRTQVLYSISLQNREIPFSNVSCKKPTHVNKTKKREMYTMGWTPYYPKK